MFRFDYWIIFRVIIIKTDFHIQSSLYVRSIQPSLLHVSAVAQHFHGAIREMCDLKLNEANLRVYVCIHTHTHIHIRSQSTLDSADLDLTDFGNSGPKIMGMSHRFLFSVHLWSCNATPSPAKIESSETEELHSSFRAEY